MFKIIKKADIILLIILVIVGGLISWLSVSTGTTGKEAVVTVNGKLYGSYSLYQDQEITIKQHSHINKITIKNGYVQMTESDCKNQLCVKQGAINKTSQSIVCLPNRVMIEIKGGKEKYDAISN